MKEITRIHLAATPFNIEIAAKKELENYLEAVERVLQADEDALREIEARIIELLSERGVVGEKVITTADIVDIKQRLGAPADFADDDENTIALDETGSQKRLMRDDEAGWLGGVMAGIGAYVGVNPNWVRLAGIALTFVSFGTAILLYIVLWLVLPAAKTTAEKLQMAGKPVTLAALKQGAASVSSRSVTKPLVVLFRILLGLGFVGVGLAAAALTIASLITGVPAFIANSSLANEWLIGAFSLFAVSGVLLTLLMMMAAYAAFAWRFTKVLGYSGLAIIIAGIVLSTTGIASAYYGANLVNEKIDSLTKVHKTELRELDAIQNLTIISKDLPVEYRQSTGTPRVEITTIDNGTRVPTAHATRDGDMVRIEVKDTRDNKSCFALSKCEYAGDRVVIYGPALKNVHIEAGSLVYDGDSQKELSVTVKDEARFTLQDTTVETLTARVSRGGSLNAEGASVNTANISLQAQAWASFGVITALQVETPLSCPANNSTQVTVKRAESVTHNGAAIPMQAETHTNCATIMIDSLEETDDSEL